MCVAAYRITKKQTMVAGAILPVAWHDGQWYLLFGKEGSLERSARGWSDFGGRVDDFDPREDPRRAAFRILESAAREGMEESKAFLGDARHILQRLVAYGQQFSGGGGDNKAAAEEAEADPSSSRGRSRSRSTGGGETRRKERGSTNSRSSGTRRTGGGTKRGRSPAAVSLGRQTGLAKIWRPAFQAQADPARDWDCLEHNGYFVFLYPMDYEPNLVRAFNANHALMWDSLPRGALAKSKLYEKCEMRWFTLDEVVRERSIFRNFYREITDKIVERLRGRKGPPPRVAEEEEEAEVATAA